MTMLKFTARDREQLAEIRQGWWCLSIFILLLAIPEVADILLGRGWSVVVAAMAAILWLVVRPWRFGLLPGHIRRGIRLMGVVVLAGSALLSLLRYWKG